MSEVIFMQCFYATLFSVVNFLTQRCYAFLKQYATKPTWAEILRL